MEGLQQVAPIMAAVQATEWQAGTIVWLRQGTAWVRWHARRGGWQGLRLMMFAFCAGIHCALDKAPCLHGTAPAACRMARTPSGQGAHTSGDANAE